MNKGNILHIVWPHRWEFDKDPDFLIDVLLQLKLNGAKFKVSILGEGFSEVPPALLAMKDQLQDEILHYGFVENKEEYYNILRRSHVAVSTAKHEFFGVSM